jgi:hypothetical protein
MNPNTESFLSDSGPWSDEVKNDLEQELPTIEVRLLRGIAVEFPGLVDFLLLCKCPQDGDIAQALDNACLIIQEKRFELLERRFYRMLIVQKDGPEFWRLWKCTATTISVLTEGITIKSEFGESIRERQGRILDKTLDLRQRLDTFYADN